MKRSTAAPLIVGWGVYSPPPEPVMIDTKVRVARLNSHDQMPDMSAPWRDFWDLVARLAAKRALQLQLEKHSHLARKNKLKTQEKNHD